MTRQDYLTEAATRKIRDHSTYATDGRCHNAEPGTYGHECGRPAEWIGTTATGFRSGYCLTCRAQGFEARRVVKWEPATEPDLIRRSSNWARACLNE